MNGDRGANGKFVPGNGAARGHAGPRTSRYAAALARALPPERMERVLEALASMAEDGDATAARVLLGYAIGRPREAPEPAAEGFALPSLRTAEGCIEAIAAVAESVARGELSLEAAGRVAALVEVARKVVETRALEQRLAALEERLGAPEGV